MKIAFSTLACPGWNLETIVTQASAMGYDGVEIRGLQGELDLPVVPALSADPPGVQALFREHKIDLVCLGCSASLESTRSTEVARQKASVVEYLELARKLGCPFVRIFAGEVQGHEDPRETLSRIAEALRSLVPAAVREGVTILVENSGDFVTSADMWFLMDAVGHPRVRCCWNPCAARTLGERPTKSLPTLASKIGMVHLCDAAFDEQGVLLEYKPPGEGNVELDRTIELLKGLLYRGYLVFEWPRLWVPSLAPPDAVLPQAAEWMRKRLEEKQPVLTAYKNDKHAPRLAVPETSQT